MKLDQIKTIHIVNFLDSLTKDGARKGYRKGKLSTGTIEINHRVLKIFFQEQLNGSYSNKILFQV